MPREGVFAEVIKEGIIRPGDVMRVEAPDENRPFTAAVIVLSDKGSRGEREDASGPAAEELLKEAGYDVVERFVIPDEPAVLKHHLIRLADSRQVDLVVTSGGTGFSMRDQTPEATLAVADPECAWYCRVHPHEVHADHRPGHVKPRRVCDPQKDPDRESAGKSEGREGEPWLYSGSAGSWVKDFARHRV